MVRHRSIQSIVVSVLTVVVFILGITTTNAARLDPGLPGNHLTIEEVEVDFDTSTILIAGEHFSFGNALEVTLGKFGSLNIVGVPTDTEIVVDFPAGGFPDGVKDYLLTVSTGNGQSQNDEYDLTVVGGALPPMDDCSVCEGRVIELTLRYLGAASADIVVEERGGVTVFDGSIGPQEMFTFSGAMSDGTLGTEIVIFVDGIENTSIHTSCSQPIGPGLISGDFEVIEGQSMANPAPLCPLL